MEQGAQAGVFEEHETELVRHVFRLDELRVTGIMTPRGDIVYLDTTEPLELNVARIRDGPHSRFPVTHGGLKHFKGIVLAKTLLEEALVGEAVASFKKHRQTMALVVNEFGDTVGLVTLNDVMEALVGDIATAEHERERHVVARDDQSWFIDGGVTVERFRDVLDIDDDLPEEEMGSYHTLGGFAMLQLDRVPRVADKFDWSGYTFEIVDMDGNRIDELLVTKHSKSADAEGG